MHRNLDGRSSLPTDQNLNIRSCCSFTKEIQQFVKFAKAYNYHWNQSSLVSIGQLLFSFCCLSQDWQWWRSQPHWIHLTQKHICRGVRTGVTQKPQKFIFEYWVFSQKSYLNMWHFKKFIFAYLKFDICIHKILYLHTESICRRILHVTSICTQY